MNIKERFKSIIEELTKNVYEREQVIKLSLLSSIAGESIFLLGPPGVAKSLIARRLKFAFKDNKSFEYLMSRFSTPDEVFGPISIDKLKKDKYERITDRYLPGSNIIFLDEIWKASPPIQNSLLTVLNEKIFRNGEVEIEVDIRVLISASNELPAQGEGLEALWDRFLVREFVDCIEDKDAFNKMIADDSDPYKCAISENIKITAEEFNSWKAQISRIQVPDNILEVIHTIRAKIYQYNEKHPENEIYVSDRRWKKIVRLLKTSAFLHECDVITISDCFLIEKCIWNNDSQIETVIQIVSESVSGKGKKIKFNDNYHTHLNKFEAEVDDELKRISGKDASRLVMPLKTDWNNRYRQFATELEEISLELSKQKEKEIRAIQGHLFINKNRSELLTKDINALADKVEEYNMRLDRIRQKYNNN